MERDDIKQKGWLEWHNHIDDAPSNPNPSYIRGFDDAWEYMVDAMKRMIVDIQEHKNDFDNYLDALYMSARDFRK